MKRRLLPPLAFLALIGLAPLARADEPPARVLAAASLQNALAAVATAFEASGGGKISLSFAGSSALARQIEEGAPADLFISADEQWMDELAKRGLIEPASRRDLLGNRLALIAPASSALRVNLVKGAPLAGDLGDGRLAMAGPTVPAGIYGEAALRALDVWPSLEAKIARADNVRGALNFVARGEAPLGIVYETDARIEPKVKIVALFPEWTHPKILYPVALLKNAGPQARRFLAFIESDKARRILAGYGFNQP